MTQTLFVLNDFPYNGSGSIRYDISKISRISLARGTFVILVTGKGSITHLMFHWMTGLMMRFKPIIGKVMLIFRPGAVVLQSFNVPLLLLGGGGYTIRNVARCWCYETGIALGAEVEDKIPQHKYYEYFGLDYTLHVCPE
ncbi:hypothetical protein DVH24_010217 [Malus domestica]|uniref:Uncharacterized protein n=1 Tax=Malus domestica TaxID=3750 RepID=A0A498JWM2_MALDO|nr:hypothetical protein DVH24_010217 [Malus domestica]